MSGIVFGLTWATTQNLALAIAFALVTGTLGGFFNGLIVSRTRIPSLVTTLATMYLYRGISMIIAGSNNYAGFPDVLQKISTTRLFGFLPVQFIYLMVLFFILDFIYELL